MSSNMWKMILLCRASIDCIAVDRDMKPELDRKSNRTCDITAP